MPERQTSVHQPLYTILVKTLRTKGVLPMNSEEALAFWVTVLQRLAAEHEFGTNADPIQEAPVLMALINHRRFAEVNLLKDDPRNIMNETWTQFELRDNLRSSRQEV